MTKIDCQHSYTERKELQAALRSFLVNLDLPLFVTLAFNKSLSIAKAQKLLNEFHYQIQKSLWGKKFYRIPAEQRIFFIAFPEHIDSNIHYHLMLKVPPRYRVLFQIHAQNALSRVLESADLKIEEPQSPEDVIKTKFYSTKDLFNELNYEHFVISTQFQRKPLREQMP
ncbi:MAG: hypothetical protein ACK5HO_04415 [Pseudomonadota bacterium]|jgi:hypothetical protein